jgi:hypothetical protein
MCPSEDLDYEQDIQDSSGTQHTMHTTTNIFGNITAVLLSAV